MSTPNDIADKDEGSSPSSPSQHTDGQPQPESVERLPDSAGDSGFTEEDATVLTSSSVVSEPTLTSEEFPQGLTSQELAHALQGQMLDHFQLQEYIGGGGMGIVFRALDTTLDRDVAVKVVASQRVSTADLQRRYLVEAQSTARLDHPNIASVHYIGQARGLPYIVFEYIDGATLRQLIQEHGPMPLGEALGYTFQIAHALAHAWRRDVVHRDIKPSNILVTPEGQAKLVDMGLARLQPVGSNVDLELTATGVTLGTFDYISPEQARDPRSADTRSDIYSLGCTLFYMLVGRPPFAEGNMMQKLLQHQGDHPPELQAIRGDIPGEVSALVVRMLAKSPEDRYQTPHELVTELASIMQRLGIELPLTLGPLPPISVRRRVSRWRKVAPWAIPLLALLATLLWLERIESSSKDAPAKFSPLNESNVDR